MINDHLVICSNPQGEAPAGPLTVWLFLSGLIVNAGSSGQGPCAIHGRPQPSPQSCMLWDPRRPAYLPHLIRATITAICEAAGKQMLFFHLWNQAVGMESGLWAPSPKGQILKWQCCLCRAPRFVVGTLSLETGGSFHDSESRNETPFWSSMTSHLLHGADYINSSTTPVYNVKLWIYSRVDILFYKQTIFQKRRKNH